VATKSKVAELQSELQIMVSRQDFSILTYIDKENELAGYEQGVERAEELIKKLY
jgi:hypothetical protein